MTKKTPTPSPADRAKALNRTLCSPPVDAGGDGSTMIERQLEEHSDARSTHALTVDAVKARIAELADKRDLLALHTSETQHPSYADGRKSVLDAIEERLGELQTGPDGGTGKDVPDA